MPAPVITSVCGGGCSGAKYGFSAFRSKFDGRLRGKIEGEKVYLLKPRTYMNLSGAFGGVEGRRFYKILPGSIIYSRRYGPENPIESGKLGAASQRF